MAYVTFAEAINQATLDAMKSDKNIVCMGIGVNDYKSVFGTTDQLARIFGNHRVFNTPVAENSVTGFAIGMSLIGLRPLVIHQRVDFAFSAFEQMINQLAKINFVSNEQFTTPVVIRMIIGKGWGQGATHSQSIHSLLLNVPGLKVYAPANSQDAYEILRFSLIDKSPSIIIEHRWLYQNKYNLRRIKNPTNIYPIKVKTGKSLTIVGISEGVDSARKISKVFKRNGIDVEIINLRMISPLNLAEIFKSVKKTGKLCIIDVSSSRYGVGGAISNEVYKSLGRRLDYGNLIISPDHQVMPASPFLAKKVYPQLAEIAIELNHFFNLKLDDRSISSEFNSSIYYDQPDSETIKSY